MKKSRSQNPNIFLVVTFLATGFFLSRFIPYLSARRDLKIVSRSLSEAATNKFGRRALRRAPVQTTLSQLAKECGIKQLMSVRSTPWPTETVEVAWEADQMASTRFLNALEKRAAIGICDRIDISATDSGMLRAAAVFQGSGRLRSSFSSPDVALTNPVRNVFTALWKVNEEIPRSIETHLSKKQEEAKAKEDQRVEQERKENEEREKREAKKRQIETDLLLTGIVNNGKEPLAVLTDRSAGNRSLMVHNGDLISEARVIGISEEKGEILLDYLGQFQVTLRIDSQAGSPRL